MSNKQIITKAKRGNKKNPPNGFKASSSLHANAVMPVESRHELMYIDPFYVRSNGGANYLAYVFRVNDLYDPDPLILSGNVSGYKELMQFYNYARVEDVTVDLKISNNENFSVLWGIFFSQQNYVGTLPNRDAAINTLENGMTSGAKLLAAKGGLDRDEIKVKMPCSTILGDRTQYEAEIGYTCQVTSSPTLPLYVHVIVASPSGTNLVNGVTTYLKFYFKGRFFSKLNLQA